jgi:integrase
MTLLICFILALASLTVGTREPRYGTRESRGSRIGTGTRAEKNRTWPQTRSTWKGLCDRAMFATLLGCGLRRSELANLTMKHVQQRDNR